MPINIGQAVLDVIADRSQVDSTLGALEGHAQSWSSRVSGVLSGAFSFTLGGFLQNAISNAVSTISGSVIGVNSMLENTNKQFTTLMHDAGAAAEHVKMLFQLGAETPFTTEELITMSKAFESAGGAALDSRENIVLFGDAAAAVQAPVDKVGMWVGRLYQAIQNGRPFGEAAMNLGELNVMSGATRMKLEDMQKAGAGADEIWKAFTEDTKKFSGAMAEQAKTWTGLTSTLSDNLQMLGARAFAPVFEGAKKLVAGLITLINSDAANAMIDWLSNKIGGAVAWATDTAFPALENAFNTVLPAVTALWNAFQTMYDIVSPIIGEALSWGENIGGSLAQGIYDSAAQIMDAIGYVGDIFTEWFAPGSPPKIAPHLDEWGKLAAEQFYGGFADADYGALDQVTKTIQTVLGNLSDQGKFAKTDIIPTAIGTREAFRDVINEIDATGDVSEETFNRMLDAAGPARREVSDVVNTYLDFRKASKDVADAQQELDDITSRWNDQLNEVNDQIKTLNRQLDPLNDQMDALNKQEDAIKQQEDLADAHKTLADADASEADKAKARIEIQKIELQQQIDAKEEEIKATEKTKDGMEEQRDIEVNAAKGRLSAAQEQQKQAQAAMQAIQAQSKARDDENKLIKDQIGLLQQLEKQAAGGGGKGKGGPPKPKPPEPPKRPTGPGEGEADGPLAGIEGAVDTRIQAIRQRVREGIQQIVGEVKATLEPIRTDVERVLGGVQTYIGGVVDVWVTFFRTRGAQIVSDVQTTFNQARATVLAILDPLSKIIGGTLAAIGTFFSNHKNEISGTIFVLWSGIQEIIRTALAIINATIVPWLTTVAKSIEDNQAAIQTIIGGAWQIISSIVVGAIHVIQGVLHTVLALIHGDWQGTWDGLSEIVKALTDTIKGVVTGALDLIAGAFGTSMDEITGTWSKNWDMLKEIAGKLISQAYDAIRDGLADIINSFTGAWKDIQDSWNGFIEDAEGLGIDLVMGFVNGIMRKAKDIANAVVDAINSAIGAGKDAAESQSPSERAARELGEPLSQGIAMGILRAIGVVKNAMGVLEDAVMDQMQDLASKAQQMLSDAITGGFDYTIEKAKQGLDALDILANVAMSKEDYEKRQADIMKLPESDKMKDLKDEAKDLYSELDKAKKEVEDIPEVTDYFSDAERVQLEDQRKRQQADAQAKVDAIQEKISANAAAQQTEDQARAAEVARQLADLENQKAVADDMTRYLQQEFDKAREQADQMAVQDPKAAAQWYDMRVEYLQRYAQLQEQIAATTDQAEKARLTEKLNLEAVMYTAQVEKFKYQADQAAKNNPLQEVMDKLNDIAANTDDWLVGNQIEFLLSELQKINTGSTSNSQYTQSFASGYNDYQSMAFGTPTNQMGQVVKQFILNLNSSSAIEPLMALFKQMELEEATRY